MADVRSEAYEKSEIEAKASEGVQALDKTPAFQSWNNVSNTPKSPAFSSEVADEDSTQFSQLSEPSLDLILKTAASFFQPICRGDSPAVMPLNQQVAGGTDVQAGQATATQVSILNPDFLSVISDQSALGVSIGSQYLGSHLPQTSHLMLEQQQQQASPIQCLSRREQKSRLSKNSSVLLSQAQCYEGKSDMPLQSSKNSSDFPALWSEPLGSFRSCGPSVCQRSDLFNTVFLPPESTRSYLCTDTPLVSLVPPATLLVPYPLILPLPMPVPLPIPIPLPPFCRSSREAYSMQCNKSTQTSTEDFSTHSRNQNCSFLQSTRLPITSVSQEDVLDLTVQVIPIHTKEEVQFSEQQDSALDLSVTKKLGVESCHGTTQKYCRKNSTSEKQVFHQLHNSQSQRSGGWSAEAGFDMPKKWTMEEHYKNNGMFLGQNSRVTGLFQTPTHTMSITETTSGVFGKKLETQSREHILEHGVVKLKRMTTQKVNIHPMKKQHIAVFLSGE